MILSIEIESVLILLFKEEHVEGVAVCTNVLYTDCDCTFSPDHPGRWPVYTGCAPVQYSCHPTNQGPASYSSEQLVALEYWHLTHTNPNTNPQLQKIFIKMASKVNKHS